jgi:hypothetical protein
MGLIEIAFRVILSGLNTFNPKTTKSKTNAKPHVSCSFAINLYSVSSNVLLQLKLFVGGKT